MATRKNEGAHEALVQWLVLQLQAKRATAIIKADLPAGAATQDHLDQHRRGHIPMLLRTPAAQCIFEVETEDTISIEHTKSQLDAF